MVGEFELTVIQDRVVDFTPEMFELGAPEGAVAAELARFSLPTGRIPTTLNPVLLNTGEQLVLIDTGSGPFFGETFGKLLDTLATLGVEREAVSTVIISHWHPDHVGAASVNGEVTFPNARYYLSQAEWDFVQDFPPGSHHLEMLPLFEAAMQPVIAQQRLAFYGDGDELVSGLRALAAPGHTPGQHIFELSSNGQRLLLTKDVADNFLVSLMHPEWGFFFDDDVALASQTRREMFGRAADEGLQILAYHFPFPGVGYVVRENDGFRFLPSI
jgi:glyoxylase-like metal-dependent hydrolase (beta-lactamase superfamily II)